ncbi:MAG: tRNA (N(6)-L-threonylcarbamoyladenosine(37)-C(2))-methylthiotransferase MtaB [Thermoanaerobaculia bacterium]
MRVFFSNLGCKLNQAELECLAREFRAAGHRIAPSLAEADLHVVNTCTVTHRAARDSRKLARRGRRLNPRLRTVLTGCYVSAEPDQAAKLAGVDLVVPNRDKDHLLQRVHEAFPEEAPLGIDAAPLPIPYVPLAFGKARALVKVEDGCNMRCAFCIIPLTRGRQRSRPLREVVEEVRQLTAGGFQEVVVTGVQISSYRWDGAGLFELVGTLLSETAVPRLRLTSIAPWQFDRRLLDLCATGRLCRHFHLSLQSGCAATLRRMRRPYEPLQFAELVETIRAAVPGVAITTDLIVGFPGESEDEFAESLRFTDEMRFARVHAFPYSSRAGTEAAKLPNHVPHPVTKERMQRALGVARRSERRFWRRHLGREAQVLWETRRRGLWMGMTDNYLRLVTRSRQDLAQRLGSARPEEVTEDGLWSSIPAPSLGSAALAGPAVEGGGAPAAP